MEEEIDIKELCFAIWRKKWIILATTVVFLILGIVLFGKSKLENNSSSNEENIIDNELSDSGIFDNQFSSKMIYVKTEFMLGRAHKYDKLEGESTYKLAIDDSVVNNLNKFARSQNFINQIELDDENQVAILLNKNSDIFTLMVVDKSKESGIEVSNKILNELKDKVSILYDVHEIITIDEPRVLEKEEIQKLKQEFQDEKINNESIVAVENANTNQDVPVASSKKKIIVVAALGFMLSCGIVVVLELFNNSVKNEECLEKVTKLKTLTKISKNYLDVSDKIKLLRVNVNECKTILITSPEKEDGKSFVAINLAKSFSRLGKKVLLVDLVNNSSKITKSYNGKGLTDYLASKDKLIEKYIVETTFNNFNMLLAGNNLDNETELLESSKMPETLSILENLYDVVIIDSSNILESANSLTVAKIAQYTILVISERKTKLENVIKAKTNVEDIGGNVIGTVLNNSEKR